MRTLLLIALLASGDALAEGLRFRFNGGLDGSVTQCNYVYGAGSGDMLATSQGGGGAGLYLRPGLQLTEFWGVDLEAAFATMVVATDFRTAIAVNATFNDLFSVSAGPVLGGIAQTSVVGGGSTFFLYAGLTAHADLHLFVRHTEGGWRRGFAIGLGGDLGATMTGTGFVGSGLAAAGFVTFGYAFY